MNSFAFATTNTVTAIRFRPRTISRQPRFPMHFLHKVFFRLSNPQLIDSRSIISDIVTDDVPASENSRHSPYLSYRTLVIPLQNCRTDKYSSGLVLGNSSSYNFPTVCDHFLFIFRSPLAKFFCVGLIVTAALDFKFLMRTLRPSMSQLSTPPAFQTDFQSYRFFLLSHTA